MKAELQIRDRCLDATAFHEPAKFKPGIRFTISESARCKKAKADEEELF